MYLENGLKGRFKKKRGRCKLMKKFDINKAVDNYLSNGYAIVNFFSPEKKQLIDRNNFV